MLSKGRRNQGKSVLVVLCSPALAGRNVRRLLRWFLLWGLSCEFAALLLSAAFARERALRTANQLPPIVGV